MCMKCIACIFLVFSALSLSAQTKKVFIEKFPEADGFRLTVNNIEYFVKGAVGEDYLQKLKDYGGNSIRVGHNLQTLNKANQLGLTALVGLPVIAERDGMNYDDPVAVQKQHTQVIDIVKKLKNHPAVLMWALGNELDFIQANVKERYNLKMWDAVNALAKEIHKIDPNHPVMTVVGSIDRDKIEQLNSKCPDLDLLGINEYGDLVKIPQWLRKFGWKKPYVITEWGPTGFWQVPATPWKAPIEETSTMKAAKYKERYENAILADKDMCLGSYVFLWRQHQERTHTWFGMFDEKGLETEAVEVMHFGWSGKYPSNRSPRIDTFIIDNKTAYQRVYLNPEEHYKAKVSAKDPEGDQLTFKWEVLEEGTSFPYGGNGERKPPAIPGLITEVNLREILFKVPTKIGAYRLFVYVYDGKGHFSTSNITFYVQ